MLSGERWSPEASATPWSEDAPSTSSLEVVLDWLLQRLGPRDTLLVFDGRSASIRATIARKMQQARNSSEIWIVYRPRREAGGRKTVFASRNRETGWVSWPVPMDRVPTRDRTDDSNEWETSTFSSTFSNIVPLAWKQLPAIAKEDKERIIGASTPVPPSKVFDSDLGCPFNLCWQEVKSLSLIHI